MDRINLLKRIDEDKTYKDEFIFNAQKMLDIVKQRFRRNVRLCRFVDDQPEDCMVDYAKFFTLKVVSYDTDSSRLCPTLEVDNIWHAHILADVKGYIDDCTYILVAFDARYWLEQPKPIFINHCRLGEAECKSMQLASKIIHDLVWPRKAKAPAGGAVKRKADAVLDLTEEDEGEEGDEEEEGEDSEGAMCG